MSYAHLQEPELLVTLSDSLALFAVAARSRMLEVQSKANAAELELLQRRWRWEQEVARLEALMAAADDGIDVPWGVHAELERARKELATADHWIQRLSAARQTFDANLPRFSSLVDQQCHGAREFLRSKNEIVDRYVAAPAASPESRASRAQIGQSTPNRMQTYQILGKTFSDVPLDLIEEPTFAYGEFQQADLRDMQRSFAQLPSLTRAIQNGTIESAIAQNPALQHAYEWFFGGESVKLEWQNGRFAINNGKHRVLLARRLGVAKLPATVSHIP